MRLILQLSLMFLLFSCQNKLTEIEVVREDCKRLINYAIQKDVAGFERLLSLDKERKRALYKNLMVLFSNNKAEFRIKDERNFGSVQRGDTISATFNKGDQDEYSVYYYPFSKNVIYTSITIKILQEEEFLLGLFWEKDNKKWKIADFVIRQLKLDGYTKSQHLSIAKTVTENGYILKGLHHLNMSFAFKCRDEKGCQLKFNSENQAKEVIEYVSGIIDDQYKFPLRINLINSRLELYDIVSARYSEDQRHYPVMLYKSDISLSDKENLRLENIELHNTLATYFKGANELDTILYRVYNRTPTPSNPNNIGFIRSSIDLYESGK